MSRKLELELEMRICEKVIDCLLKEGCSIEIWDAEDETVVKPTKDKEKLKEALKEMEQNSYQTWLIPWKEGESRGWIKFVWGNVESLISDYTVSLEETVKPAMDFADQYAD